MPRRISADIRPHHWTNPVTDTSTVFRPRGPLVWFGAEENPDRLFTSKKTLAARLFVGFNVNEQPRWSLDDVIPIVAQIRQEQGARPDSSFVVQKGVYSHETGGRIAVEDSAQIIIVDLKSTKKKKFVAQMESLAAKLAFRLGQEAVIVDIQRNGLSLETFGVGPEE